MNTRISSYDQQAIDFLAKTNTKISFRFVRHDYHFVGDDHMRDIWDITLKNENGLRRFRFGQSIANKGKQPTAYDLLACLTKADPYEFENFCNEYGYDLDSRKALSIYKQVRREWAKVSTLFTDSEIAELQEIA